ncbi:MAG: ROK family protein [Bacillota bacterium]
MERSSRVELRKRNKQNDIFNLIQINGRLSRADIKRLSKYSMNTVLNGVGVLLKQGLIMEAGIGESHGGRRPIWIEVNPEGGFFIGVEFYTRNIHTLVLNLKGERIYMDRIELGGKLEARQILETIKESVRKSVIFLGARRVKVLGIGIGVPGALDKGKGISVSYGQIANWENIALREMMKKEFGVPVYLENNVKVMALAHKWLDAGAAGDFLFLCIRSGIGMACVLQNELYTGRDNNAGEIAHFPLPGGSRRCYCGNAGCLETEASNDAMIAKAKEGIAAGRFPALKPFFANPAEAEADSFFKAIKTGQPDALKLLEESAESLGFVLAAAVTILNPPKAIIWGNAPAAGDEFLHVLKAALRRYAPAANVKGFSIERSKWGSELGALGAAALVMHHRLNFVRTA